MVKKTITITPCYGCGTEDRNELGHAPEGWAKLVITVLPVKRGRPKEEYLCPPCQQRMENQPFHPTRANWLAPGSMAGIPEDEPTDDD